MKVGKPIEQTIRVHLYEKIYQTRRYGIMYDVFSDVQTELEHKIDLKIWFMTNISSLTDRWFKI